MLGGTTHEWVMIEHFRALRKHCPIISEHIWNRANHAQFQVHCKHERPQKNQLKEEVSAQNLNGIHIQFRMSGERNTP